MYPFNQRDIEVVEHHLNQRNRFFYGLVIAIVAATLAAFFLPNTMLPTKRHTRIRALENPEPGFAFQDNSAFLIILILVLGALIIWGMYNFLGIKKLKQDLEQQEKVRAIVKVKKVEVIPPHIAKYNVDGENMYIAFEPNEYKIKKLLYNRAAHPELAEASEVLMEVSAYGKVDLGYIPADGALKEDADNS